MSFILSPYSFAAFLTTIISISVGFIAWRRRTTPGAEALAWMMAAVAEWAYMSGVERGATTLADKISWSKIEYIGAQSAAPLLLIFVISFTSQAAWLRRQAAWLFVIPAITVLLGFTNELHGLIWSGFTPGEPGSNLFIYEHGPWFWVATSYIYILLVVSAGLLVRKAVLSSGLFRRQSLMLLAASVAPWLGAIVYLTPLNPYPGLNLIPISFMFTGVIIALSVFRYQLFDLVPVARDTLVEKMLDGILVLDEQSRVVDINTAAAQLIGKDADGALGKNIRTVLAAWPKVLDQFRDVVETHAELALDEPDRRYIDLVVSPLNNRQGKMTGRLIMLRDITTRKLAQNNLQQANEQLKSQLEENEILQAKLREQAVRDPLTGTYNRTYLDDTLSRELARAERENSPVSLLMIDIDHFKAVNDTGGHKTGDLMLEALGLLFRTRTRSSDVIFRYGGEEFLGLLPGMPLDAAAERAECLREQVEALEVEHEGKSVRITISIGVATYHAGQDADAVLTAADRALYKAKALGRNCVAVEE